MDLRPNENLEIHSTTLGELDELVYFCGCNHAFKFLLAAVVGFRTTCSWIFTKQHLQSIIYSEGG